MEPLLYSSPAALLQAQNLSAPAWVSNLPSVRQLEASFWLAVLVRFLSL